MDRRHFLGVLAALLLSWCLPISGDTSRQAVVIVVFASGVEAYMEALSGLRAGLAKLAPNPILIDLKGPKADAELTNALTDALSVGQQRVVITIGTEAFTTVASRRTDAVILSTMILRSDRARGPLTGPGMQRPAAVYLDVPLAGILSELKTLLPGKSRFGMIRNSSRDEPDPSLAARAKQQGFTLHIAE